MEIQSDPYFLAPLPGLPEPLAVPLDPIGGRGGGLTHPSGHSYQLEERRLTTKARCSEGEPDFGGLLVDTLTATHSEKDTISTESFEEDSEERRGGSLEERRRNMTLQHDDFLEFIQDSSFFLDQQDHTKTAPPPQVMPNTNTNGLNMQQQQATVAPATNTTTTFDGNVNVSLGTTTPPACHRNMVPPLGMRYYFTHNGLTNGVCPVENNKDSMVPQQQQQEVVKTTAAALKNGTKSNINGERLAVKGGSMDKGGFTAEQQQQASKPVASDLSLSLVEDKKRKRILANRLSAQKSRMKKMQYTKNLQASVDTLGHNLGLLQFQLRLARTQHSRLEEINAQLKQEMKRREGLNWTHNQLTSQQM